MVEVKRNDKNSFKILIYGSEKLNYHQFKELPIGNKITLFFGKFNTLKKFQDYDGVIIFQGIWDDSQDQINELKKRFKQM